MLEEETYVKKEAYRNKKDTHEKMAKRYDIAYELMRKTRVRKHESRQKGSDRHRKSQGAAQPGHAETDHHRKKKKNLAATDHRNAIQQLRQKKAGKHKSA